VPLCASRGGNDWDSCRHQRNASTITIASRVIAITAASARSENPGPVLDNPTVAGELSNRWPRGPIADGWVWRASSPKSAAGLGRAIGGDIGTEGSRRTPVSDQTRAANQKRPVHPARRLTTKIAGAD